MAGQTIRIGENIDGNVDGENHLFLEIDLNAAGTISKSGKSSVIASTRGNQTIKDSEGAEVKLGINVYRSR